MRIITTLSAILFLLISCAFASAQNLSFVNLQPMEGAAGASVTATVEIDPPLPLSRLKQLVMIFNTPDGKGVAAKNYGADVDAVFSSSHAPIRCQPP